VANAHPSRLNLPWGSWAHRPRGLLLENLLLGSLNKKNCRTLSSCPLRPLFKTVLPVSTFGENVRRALAEGAYKKSQCCGSNSVHVIQLKYQITIYRTMFTVQSEMNKVWSLLLSACLSVCFVQKQHVIALFLTPNSHFCFALLSQVSKDCLEIVVNYVVSLS